MKRIRWISLDRLLWIDGLGALIVGILVLLLRHPLSAIFNLPVWLLTLESGITLCYAVYSITLARQRPRHGWMIRALIIGNWAYALFCIALLILFFQRCSAWGVIYFLAEVLYISGLGWVEHKSLVKSRAL